MLASLKGNLIQCIGNTIILEVCNVGYLVNVYCTNEYTINKEYFLYIKTIVKEDSIDLYGFKDYEQHLMFNELIQINGVGPKLGLNLIGKLSPSQVQFAIDTQCADTFKKVSGVGAKMAQKIILELKGKKIIQQSQSILFFESLDVLKQLGISEHDANKLLNQVISPNLEEDVSSIIAKALALRNKLSNI